MLVDLLIVLIVVFAVSRNWGTGFISQGFSAAGLIIGLLLGRLVQSYAVHLFHTSSGRALVTIVTILGIGLIGLSLGEALGLSVKHRLHLKKINVVDNYLGSLLTGLTVLLIVWLVASVVQNLPASRFRGDIEKSHIISALDKVLPSAPSLISELGRVIDPNGFPDVFIGAEPIPNTNVTTPSLGAILPAVNMDRASVVRIDGEGCGGVITGSGFVVGNGLVSTNAHVVAGISSPVVYDINGQHPAYVVWFDPNLDLAVLKTSGLAGKPLPIDLKTINSGTQGAILGYPGGGPFKADPAAVMGELSASGRNIYGNGVTVRSIYEVAGDVIPGNSGGPLIEKDGEVIGVVFAQSTSYNHVGYALAIQKVSSEINQAKTRTDKVSTGSCAQ